MKQAEKVTNLNVERKTIPFKTEATSYLGQHFYIKK